MFSFNFLLPCALFSFQCSLIIIMCNDTHMSMCCFNGLQSVKHETPIWIESRLCRVNVKQLSEIGNKFVMTTWLLYEASGSLLLWNFSDNIQCCLPGLLVTDYLYLQWMSSKLIIFVFTMLSGCCC